MDENDIDKKGGGNRLKTLFRSEFSYDSESGVKRFPPQVVRWPTNDGMNRMARYLYRRETIIYTKICVSC